MATTEWKSDFVESFVNVGIEKGLEQGREQGIVEGAIRAKAEDILKVLDARLLKPTNDQRGPGQRGHRSRPTRPLVRPSADRCHRRRGLRGLTQAALALGPSGNAHEGPSRVELVDRVVQQCRQRVRALSAVDRRRRVGQRDRRGGDALGRNRQRSDEPFHQLPDGRLGRQDRGGVQRDRRGAQGRRATGHAQQMVPAPSQRLAVGERDDRPGRGRPAAGSTRAECPWPAAGPVTRRARGRASGRRAGRAG